jgi:hypothetical protein
MNFSTIALSKKIFFILIAVLPINLGLHFVNSSAYVGGLLIDYLVPTIFVQDVLCVFLLGVYIYELITKNQCIHLDNIAVWLILLAYTLFLSVLISPHFAMSLSVFARWILYMFMSFYVAKNFDIKADLKPILKIFSVWLVFLGVLAVLQFVKQGSVFNNYLVLGEQPYSFATPQITKENVFGHRTIPAYGLFRHPNVFGGILVIFLTLLIWGYKTRFINKRWFFPALLCGITGLFLTFSYFSWAAFIFGVCLLMVENKVRLQKLLIFGFLLAITSGLFINIGRAPQFLADNPSFYKRAELLEAGYKTIVSRHYLFGVGLNASTVFIENFTVPAKFIRFVQPPHNIFVLLAAEAGILAVLIFGYILLDSLLYAHKYYYFVFVLLFEVIFLGSFDHYFLTIQQPFLAMWWIIGIANNHTE